MRPRHRLARQKHDDCRVLRAASLTPCLTCLTCLDTENALRPGNTPNPGEISYAMHLYEAGVPLPYIRDLLGHAELSTTEIYARASTEAKRKALEIRPRRHSHRRPTRMDPRPRTSRLAHQPLTRHPLVMCSARPQTQPPPAPTHQRYA
jgi:hypothetical protein